MARLTAHIINHTHWDREWFLTSVYTSRWLPGLIDRLIELADKNPDYHYFLDGQTLVVEDLLQFAPPYQTKVESLVQGGTLLIGPYYCQPDWRLTGGEALLRNLLWGRLDMQRFGGEINTGWMVDTFGHISQAPQLHRLFGIDSNYIWRGVPQLEPYFNWQGADGSLLFAVNLFGGYRNLYGVTHTPEVATRRLLAELIKLRPYYPSPDIPLFDGYDLEDNPEDPLRFFYDRRAELPAEIGVREATPPGFARELGSMLNDLPVLTGELMSGKYGAVFPGTLSTRSYLKRMSWDCEHLLYQVCEPLGTLAWLQGRPYPTRRYEAWSRSLLQNAVHDCICGVSIDLVHEKMEFSYRQVFEEMREDIQKSLEYILRDFAPGIYAVSANPFPYEGWHPASGRLCHIQTHGVGAWDISGCFPLHQPGERVETFRWKNTHYEAVVFPDGRVQLGEASLGELRVYEEGGDTYSGETGRFLGMLQPDGPLQIEERSEHNAVVSLALSANWDDLRVSARVRLAFDPSPLVRWQIELDSRGAGFRVDMIFETAFRGQVSAGMPFDMVQRPVVDSNLLSRHLEDGLDGVLLGQREIEAVDTFPFHDFVAISNGGASAAVLAKGLHSYQAGEDGCIALSLRRAVEWLAKTNLEHRVGDAGPFFYVPGARCERAVTFELAFVSGDFGVESEKFQALAAGFQNPPLLVEKRAGGTITARPFFQETLPLSSLHVSNRRLLARFFNPTSQPRPLSRSYRQTDVFGRPLGTIDSVPPKTIITLAVPHPKRVTRRGSLEPVQWANPPDWHVGPDQGLPDPLVIDNLKERILQLERQVEETAEKLSRAGSQERYRWQHQIYVLQRELLEYRLSARLNEMKLATQGQITREYLYQPDEEIATIGRQLNQLRIKRRIYDYIVQVIGTSSFRDEGNAES